jgi:two-component system, cell cycle response regulator DivK
MAPLHIFRGSSVAKRVLVVEDNELNLKLFCDLLRARGYDSEGVRDARDAMERAQLFMPDVIVMDIQMPHISGLELIEAIRRDVVLRRIPIMAVTAYASQADEDRIREAGADAYVSKPVTLMRFTEVIQGLVQVAESRA